MSVADSVREHLARWDASAPSDRPQHPVSVAEVRALLEDRDRALEDIETHWGRARLVTEARRERDAQRDRATAAEARLIVVQAAALDVTGAPTVADALDAIDRLRDLLKGKPA